MGSSSAAVQLSMFEPQNAQGSRFDLWNAEFREHLKRLTGVVFDDADLLAIEWWQTATENDARNARSRTVEDERNGVSLFENTGAPQDLSKLWRIQTRKFQLAWDAWIEGRKVKIGRASCRERV